LHNPPHRLHRQRLSGVLSSRTYDAKLLHPRAQGVWINPQPVCGIASAIDPPTARLTNDEDVVALHLLQRADGRQTAIRRRQRTQGNRIKFD
jgi:hypothetical protein